MQANSMKWPICQDDVKVENPKDVFMPGNKGNSPISKCPLLLSSFYTPGNGGNSPISKCRPDLLQKVSKNLQWKIKMCRRPAVVSAHASLAPHVQGGVRNSCCSTHVSVWPLHKDDTHCVETLGRLQILLSEIQQLSNHSHAERMDS